MCRRRGFADTQRGILPAKAWSAMCVQNFDDSRSLAIRITYRISLRSSSMWEPRHPLLKVVYDIVIYTNGGRGRSRRFGAAPHSNLAYILGIVVSANDRSQLHEIPHIRKHRMLTSIGYLIEVWPMTWTVTLRRTFDLLARFDPGRSVW